MKIARTSMESLDRISFDIPRPLLLQVQQLAREGRYGNIQNFMNTWFPRLIDLAKNWELNEALVNNCLDDLRLSGEEERA